jgi:type II secretory pathway pseudopilin PulG
MPVRLSRVLLAVVLAGATIGAIRLQPKPAAADTTKRAVAAAEAFLGTLDERQRVKANPDLNEKTRTVWSNLPTGTTMQVGARERNGVKLGDLTPAQEKAALALVAATLSRDGFQKAMAIVDADQILEVRSAPNRQATSAVRFGRAEYYVSILGKPSMTAPWMIQFGGHHLAINVTLAGRENVLTPTHTGSQPATYSVDGRTVRPLGDENDKAFALVNALDTVQQKQAILGFEVRNLVLGPGTDGKTIAPEGVRASTFTPAQRTMLLDLVREWVEILDTEAASAKMKEVESGLSDTYFAWAGPTTNGKGAYFRIQGPAVLIEYAPQGQPDANTDHIHTIFRDPTNDYAARTSKP